LSKYLYRSTEAGYITTSIDPAAKVPSPLWISGITFASEIDVNSIFYLEQNVIKLNLIDRKRSEGTECDQIGQIFAHWVINYFGQFFEN
jgi:hypothetical protein